jgi:hypothetical protein
VVAVRLPRFGKMRYARGIYCPFGVLHADKDGSPVLRDCSSWRTVSGFFTNMPRCGFVFVEFRRFSE